MAARSLQEHFEARLAACRTNLGALQAIEQEVQRLAAPWAGKLRLRVIHARAQLRSGRSRIGAHGSACKRRTGGRFIVTKPIRPSFSGSRRI
jgi:hypothetical protein